MNQPESLRPGVQVNVQYPAMFSTGIPAPHFETRGTVIAGTGTDRTVLIAGQTQRRRIHVAHLHPVDGAPPVPVEQWAGALIIQCEQLQARIDMIRQALTATAPVHIEEP